MNDRQREWHKKFAKKITRRGAVSFDLLKEAVGEFAPQFHISYIMAKVSDRSQEDAKDDGFLLFESKSADFTGTPLKFRYSLDPDRSMALSIYPDHIPFSKEECDELEYFAAECFLFYELSLRSKMLDEMAKSNYVSGLPNADAYCEMASELLSSNKGHSYSTFFFNLKSYMALSRQLGLEGRNELLRAYVGRLQEYIEADECLGHLGGDNFAALIKTIRKDEFIYYLGDVELPIKAPNDNEFLRLSATIGVWDVDGEIFYDRDIIDRPYIAYINAKYISFSPVVTATRSMLQKSTVKRAVLKSYKDALNREEFLVLYQPKVDSGSSLLVGAEALSRWMHNGRVVSPATFIQPLEENGEIELLDFYVFRRVCQDIRNWLDDGFEPVPVSVNFSHKDLLDKDLAKKIEQVILDSGIEKRWIEIEVTETTDRTVHTALSSFVKQLNALDINVAIDHFGSGYSTLSTLREFKAHTLKLDRSFLTTDDFTWKDEIILSYIIRMARKLNIEIIAEGVEREDQLTFINNAGCDLVQGFYYDQPLSHDAFEARLLDKKYP